MPSTPASTTSVVASGNSSPFLLLTNVAARTERIRVGTSVICAPFHNPLRLAEDIAALDIASKGRFDFGVGVGSQWEEFRTFGINPKERVGRTWEIVDIIERCLHGTDETFDWEGKYYQFPNVRWIMQPVQTRIPILWGSFGPQSVARAARRGYHLIASDVTGTPLGRPLLPHGGCRANVHPAKRHAVAPPTFGRQQSKFHLRWSPPTVGTPLGRLSKRAFRNTRLTETTGDGWACARLMDDIHSGKAEK